MIVFDLACHPVGHCFEGWFGSSEDFAAQQSRGLVSCPECGSTDVTKAPMAPSVGRKGNQLSISPPIQAVSGGAPSTEAVRLMQALHAMQTKVLQDSRWVGDGFAEHSRAMHYGERETESIHGEATLQEARELLEEGIEIAPLPFPVAPPGTNN
ncbi:MAG TPA: DUF1178 family protein [Novosphingobium sp.]